MGQRILGIDPGAHQVKVAVIEAGFQKTKLLRMSTIAVSEDSGPVLEKSFDALAGAYKPSGATDLVVVGFPGDRALLRVLDVPVADPRKWGPVVGNELADDLPWEMEDVVFDHTPLWALQGKALVAAARSNEVRAALAHLSQMGLEPHALPVAPLSYAGLVRLENSESTDLVVDLGHRRTNLCLVHDGRTLMGRTIYRAGHQITEAFQRTFQVSYQEAEVLKEQQAFLVPADQLGSLEPARRPFAQVTAEAFAPLLRDLRISLGMMTGTLGVRPQRLLLCGGTSLLRGVDSLLSTELGVLAQPLQVPQDQANVLEGANLSPEDQARGALSLSLALGQGSRQTVDLRQGEFSFRQDSSFLKDKLPTLAISLALVLLFAGLNAMVSCNALEAEHQQLTEQLAQASRQVFGETMENPEAVSRKVKLGSRATSSGIPEKTAFDILNMISSEIPGGDQVKLDLSHLDIKPGKTYLKGTADTRKGIGDIVQSLEKNECFTDVSAGTISDVADGKKQFTLNITTSCY